MNVLILAGDGSYGGLPLHCGNLALGLSNFKNCEVVIGINNGLGADYLSKHYRVKFFKFGSKNPLMWIRMLCRIHRIVKEYNIQIIHSQNRIPSLFASLYCSVNRSVKYIWANHLVPIPSDFLHRLFTRYGYCAVAEGIAGKQLLMSALKIPDDKVKIVNLGIDLSRFEVISDKNKNQLKREYGIIEQEKVLLLYGSLSMNKGHLFLMESLAKVDHNCYKLVFPGEDENYKSIILKKATELGVDKKIVFPGFINGPEWLSISDLMVLPSKSEGFPQACVEAFAMGVPVIRTKTGGYEDTADMCFGVEYGDTESLSGLLNEFFINPLPFIEKASFAKVEVKRFSIEKMADDYYSIYKEAIQS